MRAENFSALPRYICKYIANAKCNNYYRTEIVVLKLQKKEGEFRKERKFYPLTIKYFQQEPMILVTIQTSWHQFCRTGHERKTNFLMVSLTISVIRADQKTSFGIRQPSGVCLVCFFVIIKAWNIVYNSRRFRLLKPTCYFHQMNNQTSRPWLRKIKQGSWWRK